jgi:homocysteine S-methyltransferase
MHNSTYYAALKQRLDAGKTILIDGGTGTELERRGATMIEGAWCGAGGLSEPDLLQQIHEDYIKLGAEVVVANTFASSRHICEQGGFGDRFESANRSSVAAAIRARDAVGPVVVAGSVSTTHQGGPQPPPDVAARNHADQAMILADEGCDLLIAEMMRDVDMTNTLLDAVRPTGLPLWVGFSVVDRDGEIWMIEEAMSFADGLAQIDLSDVDLVAIMHSEVAAVDAALDVLAETWSGPTGVYAQTGGWVPPNWQFIDMISPTDYSAAATRWASTGVQVLGGCCGIGPEHIADMADLLTDD